MHRTEHDLLGDPRCCAPLVKVGRGSSGSDISDSGAGELAVCDDGERWVSNRSRRLRKVQGCSGIFVSETEVVDG